MTESIELAVGEYETAFSIQIWKSYLDEVDISIESARAGDGPGRFRSCWEPQRFVLEETEHSADITGSLSPYSQSQELYLELLPRGELRGRGDLDTGADTGRSPRRPLSTCGFPAPPF